MGRHFTYSRLRTAPPETLLAFLGRHFPYHDAARWAAQVAAGLVQVGGAVCTDGDRVLRQQDRITYDPPAAAEPDVDGAFRLLHCDAAVAVFDKPANLPVAEGGRYSKHTLAALAAPSLPPPPPGMPSTAAAAAVADGGEAAPAAAARLYPVHRLDKDTSGVVVMARTPRAAEALAAQFAAHAAALERAGSAADGGAAATSAAGAVPGDGDVAAAAKEYDVVLLGTLRSPRVCRWNIGRATEAPAAGGAGAVDAPPAPPAPPTAPSRRRGRSNEALADARGAATAGAPGDEVAIDKLCMNVFPRGGRLGKPARTEVTPLATAGGLTLARVRLFTGRTHQIRVHCAAMGHPVAGDKLYLPRPPPTGSPDGDDAATVATVPGAEYLRRVRTNAAMEVRLDTGDAEAAAGVLLVPRQLLHARRLEFVHPETKQLLSFESDGLAAFCREVPGLASLFPPTG